MIQITKQILDNLCDNIEKYAVEVHKYTWSHGYPKGYQIIFHKNGDAYKIFLNFEEDSGNIYWKHIDHGSELRSTITDENDILELSLKANKLLEECNNYTSTKFRELADLFAKDNEEDFEPIRQIF